MDNVTGRGGRLASVRGGKGKERETGLRLDGVGRESLRPQVLGVQSPGPGAGWGLREKLVWGQLFVQCPSSQKEQRFVKCQKRQVYRERK